MRYPGLDENMSSLIARHAMEGFFTHVEKCHEADGEVENVRGCLLRCELRINDRPVADGEGASQ